jgi:predicted NUDIX family phosphoesterase
MSEQVLVVDNDILSEISNGFNIEYSSNSLNKILNNSYFTERDAAEKDYTKRQIIPYVIVSKGINEYRKILVYERTKKSGEDRLHKKVSIGFGGHINPIDGNKDLIYDCIIRELKEELDITVDIDDIFCHGFIKLSEVDVDKVHLGVVFEANIDPCIELKEEDSVNLVGWVELNKLFSIISSGKYFDNLLQKYVNSEFEFESWTSCILLKFIENRNE